MNDFPYAVLKTGTYDRSKCIPGVVHLGYGAFHRAHQAFYFDKYMQATNDLRWGILAVNLRAAEARKFAQLNEIDPSYVLKSTAPNGQRNYQLIKSHIGFADWTVEPARAEELLALPTVHLVTITVTESGYYLDESGQELNLNDPTISAEVSGQKPTSLYGYLAKALQERADWADEPLTILCCDNIRSNGKMLKKCLLTYLDRTNRPKLARWVREFVSFPCSMVDRITPRTDGTLLEEISATFARPTTSPVQCEEFAQWVIADDFAGEAPDLARVGVQIVDDVDPYEEAKIRILNGGHSGLCYLGALAGHKTFDQAMRDPALRAHFDGWQQENILPGLDIALPFDTNEYCAEITQRFCNEAIADSLERICMDGWSKMPIYIRPTLRSCLKQGITPSYGYDCIASWYVFARRFANGDMRIKYFEPYWEDMAPLLEKGREGLFARNTALWDDLPSKHEEFVPGILSAIEKMEAAWPA